MPAGLAFNRSYTENSRRRVESDTGAFVISKGWVSFYEFASFFRDGLPAAFLNHDRLSRFPTAFEAFSNSRAQASVAAR